MLPVRNLKLKLNPYFHRMDELFLVTKWNLLNREVIFCALNQEDTILENKLDELLMLEMKHIVRKSNRLEPKSISR